MQTFKSLFVTLLILAGAFLAYDYYVAPAKDKIVFKTLLPIKTEPAAPTPLVVTTEAASPKPAPAPPAPITPIAEPSVPTPPPATPTPSEVSAVAQFVPPHIPSVEDATANWTRIPPSAFPRQVKLLQAATFEADFGNTQISAGTAVTALALQDGALTLAPNPTSTLRATVPVDDTDLKFILTQIYGAWREQRVAYARQAWEKRDTILAPAVVPEVTEADGRPQRDSDGTYPLLLASMKSGDVTEVTPQSITHWGDPEKSEVNGRPCWVVPVDFEASTAFGKFPTVAVARVVDGHVTGWYYKGSGEQVP